MIVSILLCMSGSLGNPIVRPIALNPIDVVENHYADFPSWEYKDPDSEGWDGMDLCDAEFGGTAFRAEYFQYYSDSEINELYDAM